jgi:hypothetical protein
MNKFETREVTKTIQHGAQLGVGYMARSLSALIRGAMTTRSRNALILVVAGYPDVVSHPDFIV